MYGGDGQTTFALPDLRGRLPVHFGAGFVQAQSAGVEEVTLSTTQIPQHNHSVLVTTGGSVVGPAGSYFATATESTGLGLRTYTATNPNVAMSSRIVSPDGGGQPHSNIQPFLCLSFIISLYGIYPTPT
jgi:microcystin-dependent protein